MNSWDHAPTLADEEEAGWYYPYYAYGYLTTAQWMTKYGERLIKGGAIDAEGCDSVYAYAMAQQWISLQIPGIQYRECGGWNELFYFGVTATHKNLVLTDADFEEMEECLQRAFRTDAKPRWYGLGRKRWFKKEDSESVAKKEASESMCAH